MAEEVKNRLPGHKTYLDLENPLRIPPKIKLRIFCCYVREPEMKFSEFHTPEMGRKLNFLLIWVKFVWYKETY